MDDTLTVLGTNGTATFDCAAQVVDPLFTVDTTPNTNNTIPNGTVTYTIEVDNVSTADLTNLMVSDTFIALRGCAPNPSIPFNLGAGQTETFTCGGVTIPNSITNTTTATATLTLTNTATLTGTSAVLQDTVVTVVTAVDSDQTTVTTNGFQIFLPVVEKPASPLTSAALPLMAAILPIAGVVFGGVMKRRRN